MKVRHGEESYKPVRPRVPKNCGAYSLVKQLRLPGGGSRGEAETAYAEYGMLRATEQPMPARRREERRKTQKKRSRTN